MRRRHPGAVGRGQPAGHAEGGGGRPAGQGGSHGARPGGAHRPTYSL